ncbi:imidazole glycerol phosphate synthase, glutamine amidotransferase subunit [Candidatus Pelagibacter sp. HTCC7211]|uniref:imidazole glycerol phosphate synthase subunit HisH n=1 Tax=Pelagibacter sp. (strain HTCC7211) TaxID=439493 RepID=UPI000183A56B|nr:imidazole glycerol phosphate synthase subunit HisH [Candidatus Pelagibacter sp. HTCC7211]EDZ60496.1 imidazole glycerol phosphate synthase, glutamine amidotransferase subunit [Candidatus Pelagibacter sp. HTCC7211]MBD1151143.1 imidazole glycerol phosphate synthase subunit HisH [Pelagibacterales bacterium SAG-MED25]
MTIKVAIINYGIGNIRSLYNSLKRIEVEAEIITDPDTIDQFDKVFLPGVGSYKDAIKKIKYIGWDKAIKNFSSNQNKSLFGICVGMQILSTCGYEYGKSNGLNIIKGEVLRMNKHGCDLKLPHIGWNNIKIINQNLITENLNNEANFYFVNSYSLRIVNSNELIATTSYGIEFPSIINKQNVFGTQFHPEKSSKAGMQILKNFLNA